MVNKLQQFIYSLSSTSPLAFVFAIVWYQQYKTLYIPMAFISLCFVLILLFYLSLKYAKRHLASTPIRVSELSPNDGWIIAYIISYLLPFSSIALKDVNITISALISLILVLILPFINSAIPNPLLFICGYHFYSVNTKNGISNYILISKRVLRSPKQLKSVQRMSEYLLLDMEGDRRV